MCDVTYDRQWKEAMETLVQLKRAENPQRHDYPKDLSAWSISFLRYVQALRKLEAAHSHMVQPQKRKDLRQALECCMGRMLEIRNWMVHLNKGLDVMSMEPAMSSLGLTPDLAETPIPTCYREDRAEELEDRAEKLTSLANNIHSLPQAVQPLAGFGDASKTDAPLDAPAIEDPVIPQEPKEQQEEQATVQYMPMPRMSDYLPRKSTHRPRSTIHKPIEEQQSVPGGLSKDEAATRIQSAMRGFTSRRTVECSEARELVFLGMQPQVRGASLGDKEPTAQDTAAAAARKTSQEQMQHLYRVSLVSQRSEIMLVEGMTIREALQEKINTWVTTSRGPDGDQIPKYPSEADGGSKSFLEPLPAAPQAPSAEQAKGKQPGRAASAAAKGKEPPKKAGATKSAQPAELPIEIQHACADDLETAIKEWQDRWADRDEPGAGAWAAQQLDKELLKAEVRPSVEEQIRLQSDEEMRMLLDNIKDMAAAELNVTGGNKAKGKAKDAKGQKKAPAKAAAKELAKGPAKAPAPEKKRKDMTADRTVDELYAELAGAQLVQPCPRMRLADFLGAPDLSARGLTPGDVAADPSLADLRAAVTTFCILPLASSYVHDRVAAVRSLLLYGAKGTGKTMLVHAIAHESGACFFNLSPRQTDGKYQGKAACSLMVHMVFKVAKAMAPSVIHIDEAEKVFIMDKRKAEELGGVEPFNRIKRDLLAEIAALAPTDRVLVIGTSSEPFNCKRRDEAALGSAFDKLFYVPLPDYASRQVLWSGLVEKHDVPLQKGFDMSTVLSVSEGYSAGGLEQVLKSIMADRQQSQTKAALTADDVLLKLRHMPSIATDIATELMEWKMHTPVYKAITEGEKDEASDKSKSKSRAKKG